jgi:CheY-like chemotaxis protein
MDRDPTREPLLVLAGDDEDFLMIIKLALEHTWYRGGLMVALNAGELIELLTKISNPSIVIMDFQTSPNDWYIALNRLKRNKRFEHIPVVVLSSSVGRKRMEGEDLPNCTYIEKPASFEGWRKAMADVLRRYPPSSFA